MKSNWIEAFSRKPTAQYRRPMTMKDKLKSRMTYLSRFVSRSLRSWIKRGYKAICQKRGVAPFGDDVIVVDGQFTDVTEGNRLSRTVIGFGAGASTLNTDVVVMQLAQGTTKRIMQFSTHADGGHMPGVAVTGAPGAAAGGAAAVASLGVNMTMSAVKAHKSSIGSLADLSAEQILEHLTEYFGQQGWTGNVASSN
jgi:hypothetical protein